MAKERGQALLPRGPVQTPEKLARRQEIQVLFLEAMLENDGDWRTVVKKLGRGDKKVAKRWRRRYLDWCKEPMFAEQAGYVARGEAIGNLIGASVALGRRARKGNVPAIKLLMEATGFYSPRQIHDHTGEIGVTIKHEARPRRTEDETPVVDATVVEDS